MFEPCTPTARSAPAASASQVFSSVPSRSTRALIPHLVREWCLTTNAYRRERGFRKAPEKVTAEVMDVLSLSPAGSSPTAIVAEAQDD